MRILFVHTLLWLICVQGSVVFAAARDVILDVRTPVEYAQGHIPGAINIDVLDSHFRERVSPMNRNDQYKVYCKSGKRATEAVNIMKDMGFSKLENLGGFEDAQRILKVKPTIQ